MPHTRENKGRVLPLQTPQAFTNRAYRFRVPNQIPAAKPKNGSKTYRNGILKSLAQNQASTTEGLSTLNQDQIKKVKKANKGKFKANSRYVVGKDGSTDAPLPKKRVHQDDGHESSPEQRAPNPKRRCTQTPQHLGAEMQSPNDVTPGYIHHDNRDASWHLYDEPTGDFAPWDDQQRGGFPMTSAAPWENQGQGNLVPLFATIEDQGLALVEDESFTSPAAVIQARRNGNQQTWQINVFYYSPNIPRYQAADGSIVEEVAHSAFWDQYQAVEPIPDDAYYV